MNDKKIGIIGGVGPQSTDFIYEKIIQFSQTKYGAKNNEDYPRLVIESIPVPDFISNKENIERAKEMLIYFLFIFLHKKFHISTTHSIMPCVDIERQ